ncbi:MAG: succinate--CoA ligase subunit alpha [Candidatus Andersenbacteria bacterium]|nr:succinate--CoA ligase subunit alpha [Candidatus Andersenbacteria bacterium]
MAILVDHKTNVLVQGITGTEGSRAVKEMLLYGTTVVAGVTPGKGGQKVEKVPVYNSIKEALKKHPEINTTLVAVPPMFVKDAILEAVASRIPLINVLTEKVPVADIAYCFAAAQRMGVRIVGPSSVGIISPGKAKVGAIGAAELVDRVFKAGVVGVISKSGGMTAEISRILTEAGLGQSTAVGIGGEVLLGSDFVDLARLFEADRQTKVIVIFGEVGGPYEELLAEAMTAGEITKPVVALIAGGFSTKLPSGTVLGHAGAIVSAGKGSAESKIRALTKAGARIAKSPEDIPKLVKKMLG